MKNFKFLRGDEDESQIISQYEWNRRRDALAERYRNEIESSFSERIQIRNGYKKNSITPKKINSLFKNKWFTIFITFVSILGGLYLFYGIIKLVDVLVKLI